MRRYTVIAALLCMIIFAGCGRSLSNEQEVQEDENIVDFTSMEEEPELSYEVPVSTPGILIDQLGYMTQGSKIAVFRGEEIPDEFRVVNTQTGKVVFTGFLKEKRYNENLNEYNSYGDFSALTIPGNYYIDAPVLGRSYSFAIEDDIYDQILKEACKEYYYNRCGMTLTTEYAGGRAHNACHTGKAVLRENASESLDVSGGWHQDEKGQKDVVSASKAMSVMMLSYELHGKSFDDNMGIPESGNEIPDILDEIRYEVEWLLKMQDQQTGAVYSGLTVDLVNNVNPGKSAEIYVEPATSDAGRAFAVAIAKFSYLYQDYDAEYAAVCLKAAERAYKYVKKNEDEKNELEFAAAAELYRATGRSSYLKAANDFLSAKDLTGEKNDIMLLGSVTYIATRRSVNISLCEKIMKMLMMQAEDISGTAENSTYLAAGSKEQDNNNILLLDMMYLTVVNHIISNQEYGTVIEDHLHYFLGRNEKAISYIDNAGEKSYSDIDSSLGIMKQFDANSKLIFMLSEIVE